MPWWGWVLVGFGTCLLVCAVGAVVAIRKPLTEAEMREYRRELRDLGEE